MKQIMTLGQMLDRSALKKIAGGYGDDCGLICESSPMCPTLYCTGSCEVTGQMIRCGAYTFFCKPYPDCWTSTN